MSASPLRPKGTLYREVWRVERQIRSERSPYHRVGHDGWPGQELVRFRTSQHLGFGGQDVVDVQARCNTAGYRTTELAVDCLGLTGARGALPSHYTEMVLSQLKAREPALRDFLDLFNHRLISLFYRSWEKTQPAVHQERDEEDCFTTILKALTSSKTLWEIYYGAALARGATSATTLRAVLTDLTGMPVFIRSLQGGWQRVAREEQTRLPSQARPHGTFARLGDAMLGSRAWLADKGAEIIFQPRNSAQLSALLRGGRLSAAVAHMTTQLVSGPTQIRYRIRASAADIRGMRLGGDGRLGIDSFVAARPASGQHIEVSFKPSQGKESTPCPQ